MLDYRKGVQNPEVILNPYKPDPIRASTKIIEEGYHSYKKRNGNYSMGGIFMIPRGSKYYYNHIEDEYVSSNIIYLGRDTWFNRLKLRLKGTS